MMNTSPNPYVIEAELAYRRERLSARRSSTPIRGRRWRRANAKTRDERT